MATLSQALAIAVEHHRAGRLDLAEQIYRRMLDAEPNHADAVRLLGVVLRIQGKLDEAVEHYRHAAERNPQSAIAQNDLGVVLVDQGNVDAAVDCYRRSLQLGPNYAAAHNNLATALLIQGNVEDAVVGYARARELSPDRSEIFDCYLCALRYCPGVDPAAIKAACADYDRRWAAPLRSTWRPYKSSPQPDRPLRVGFVSPRLAREPTGCFLIRVLENLDRRQCEVVCYSDRTDHDAVTDRCHAASSVWRDVFSLADEQLAEQIRADRIDILFDLAGHAAAHRLLVFARKPAPIQITWIDSVGTTGLSAIDYVLADRHLIPVGSEAFYTEQVLRMPDGYVCYDPPADAPAVGPLPAARQGFITFASFNNPAKIHRGMVELWSRILNRVPGSRLLLKYAGFQLPATRRRYEQLFAPWGVSADRLDLRGRSPYVEYLEQYNEVDLALDPFPHSGGVTTCDSLWMGVPVVTCPGQTFASRQSLSHLSNIGFVETIAGSDAEYEEIAVALSQDLPRLAALRATLRDQMASSPLCDGNRFAQNFLALLRDVWRRWDAEKGGPRANHPLETASSDPSVS